MKLFKRVVISTIGMTMLSIGIGFIINSHFGDDILTLSIEAFRKIWPLSVGTYNLIYGSIMVIVALVLDRRKIGYATVYYVVVGMFLIDKAIEIIPIATSIYIKLLYSLIAIVLMSLSVGLTIAARLGLGYYDAFLYAVSDKLKTSYVVCRYILEGSLLIFSIFLKTYPGIGSIIYFFVLGPAVNWTVNKLKKPIRKYIGTYTED